jgi:hypothetical protein
MRLRSSIWVKAYVRRCMSSGVAAAVVHHGDDDAGAIFVRVNRLDGTSAIYGPAPAGLVGLELDRQFSCCLPGGFAPDCDADAFLSRQRDFDTDLWVVEIESRDGRHFLDDWLAREQH